MKKAKKEILLEAFTKEDFTDQRIIDFKQMNDEFSSKEYQSFLKSISIGSENSKRVINFLSQTQNGSLCPQKCDAYEPIKENFNPYDIARPVSWLSQPGAAFYFKRRLSHFRCDGVIENRRFAPVWEWTDDNIQKLLKPVVPEPDLFGQIKIWFDEKDLLKYDKNILFVEEILHELDQVVKIEEYSISIKIIE